ncbi:response regulator [bacterium]|nr:response regulator [candidate division CSSED10-310 bacterium]
MARERILVVDDEADIRELLLYNLEKEGYQVACVATGEEALTAIREQSPQLVVLDLMLPGIPGLDVCRQIKGDAATRHIAIVMLSAKGEDADIVSGLELGADDYVTKPFSPRVLTARIRNVLRRGKANENDAGEIIQADEITICPAKREVMVGWQRVELTATEFDILHLLARKAGWVFSREQIINAVKGDDYPVTERSIDVQIVGLRRKLGDAGNYIETVRGVGYRFKE